MKSSNTVFTLLAGMLLGAAGMSAGTAQAQSCQWGIEGNKAQPPGAGDWSYSSGYTNCSQSGYTGRSWLSGYAEFQGWRTISGRRSSACGLPSETNVGMYVYGDTLDWNTGVYGGAWRMAGTPSGCTSGTGITRTLTAPNTFFYNSACSIGVGAGCTASGSGQFP
jgi:hypothetical protein